MGSFPEPVAKSLELGLRFDFEAGPRCERSVLLLSLDLSKSLPFPEDASFFPFFAEESVAVGAFFFHFAFRTVSKVERSIARWVSSILSSW